ncbi:hypothetical protein [Streptomyces sp. NPDC088727]|uniref:hypothetical protein n=1 Tax=Streptomyces sp. NPDC088727 TaxID=3365875 RepID=UPI00380C83E0
MTFLGRWPDGFTPEEHGWQRDPLNAEHLVWMRWEVPFLFPATISECLHDPKTGAVGGWYNGPVQGVFPEQARAGDIWAEMLRTDLNDFNKEHS